ncbi:LPS-assembly protein LptD [Poseidonibacter lekithochrous]|uniref:LPS-assembly protein LptD n=1 Tax=Poseidonibacter lekithochrous TaxID=1904463 RepID=UPI0008FCB154|nr:LPS assembly protein LptD [Poseidonibacter lekithochrous]QKJ23128.1 lipooligosaccharide transport system, OM translocon component LptD [Poseidonibacter lekithochrous]
MLKHIIAPLIIASSLSFAQEMNTEKFQLLAKSIDTKNDKVIASGDVVIFSNSYYISAKKIIYDKTNETFELFDDVLILKDNSIQTQSDYAFVDMKEDAYKQSPVFLIEKESNLWANSQKSSKEKTEIDLESSIISSCDCIDPAWSIRVSSATYNTENKWIHAYNPRLYIKNVPVFYSPYLGFPTDRRRRSGLLIPTMGYSNNDGFYYSQPIYFAPKANYDFEFIPQFRSKRGYGAFTHFRLADSQYSLLKLKTGFFEEKGEYQREFNLKNRKHYGWSIDYERTKLFSDNNTQDGLYASINWLNDIEYQTIEDKDNRTSSEKNVESKLNYFYNTPEYYGGLYARYYIDTEKDNNDETLQELPQLQFHSYNKEFLLDNLIYSADAKFINYTRSVGLNANIYELSLPISYTKYFADDYLYLNIENKTIVSKYEYTNSSKEFNNATLVQNVSSVSVGTDLIKPYESVLHTVNFNAKYSHPENITSDGDLYNITNNDSDLASFPFVQSKKNILLSFNQSLYNKTDLQQIINHKLSQSILYDENDNPELHDLENYIKYNYEFGSLTNKMIYNVQDKQFIENTSNISYSYKDVTIDLGYYKSKNTPNSNKENLESYRINTTYDISKDYTVGYYENYNLLDNIKNKQGFSFNVNDKCWNLDFKFEKEIIPSTSTNTNSVDQDVIYVNLILKPLGGLKQNYKVKGR